MSTSDVLTVLKIENFQNIPSDHKSRNARASSYHFFIFYIFNKITQSRTLLPPVRVFRIQTGMETSSNRLSSTRPPSSGATLTPSKHTLDLLKTTSRRDTETTPPHSDTHASETLLNLANISGPSKTAR